MKMFGGLARMFPQAPLWLSTGLHHTRMQGQLKYSLSPIYKRFLMRPTVLFHLID